MLGEGGPRQSREHLSLEGRGGHAWRQGAEGKGQKSSTALYQQREGCSLESPLSFWFG